MKLKRAFLGCFCAVECAALVVCVGLMIFEGGLFAILEGVATWIFGQVVILPIAIMAMPFGALVRAGLGYVFDEKKGKVVALTSGALVGVICYLGLIVGTNAGFQKLPFFLCITGLAGLFGGWIWWRIEEPNLTKDLV